MACGVVFTLTIGLLWRLGEPPVLLLPAGIQVLQVAMPRIYANFLGVSMQDVSLILGDTTAATWFALAAMLSLVIGMWCSQWGRGMSPVAALQREAQAWSVRGAFVFCIVTMVLAAMFDVLGALFDGLRQLAIAAAGIQWVGVFILACACTAQRRGFGYLLIMTGLEVVRGFSGYFGDFRIVFFVLIVSIFSAPTKHRPRILLIGSAVGGTLLLMAIWWSAIKNEYRTFLDKGSSQQVVLVPFEDRIEFLLNKLVQVDGETIEDGLTRLAYRIGYVDFLAATMRNVPSNLPFQNGEQIGATMMNVLQPRLLFPDKPPLPNDSDILEKYTGINFGESSGSGTSVSLGYVAELYVDFGPFGAVIATFIMGLLGGRAIRYVYSSGSLPAIVSYGLAVMLSMTMTQFEQALIKMVGGFLTSLAVVLVLRKFLLPPLLTMLGLSDQRKVLAQAAE